MLLLHLPPRCTLSSCLPPLWQHLCLFEDVFVLDSEIRCRAFCSGAHEPPAEESTLVEEKPPSWNLFSYLFTPEIYSNLRTTIRSLADPHINLFSWSFCLLCATVSVLQTEQTGQLFFKNVKQGLLTLCLFKMKRTGSFFGAKVELVPPELLYKELNRFHTWALLPSVHLKEFVMRKTRRWAAHDWTNIECSLPAARYSKRWIM